MRLNCLWIECLYADKAIKLKLNGLKVNCVETVYMFYVLPTKCTTCVMKNIQFLSIGRSNQYNTHGDTNRSEQIKRDIVNEWLAFSLILFIRHRNASKRNWVIISHLISIECLCFFFGFWYENNYITHKYVVFCRLLICVWCLFISNHSLYDFHYTNCPYLLW